ncbi:hypothetical protein [Streptomyces huiliensis]|uniref:hypothetical protein n=1 Tax=Streptomyces huiliensis TaxID=2876027 RepID=UPI001CC04A9F|nr:hypothetical protein [Streptomyces huiliensis]MBZ4319995.1 hypothetical protein [Streptomyces huiliensis]
MVVKSGACNSAPFRDEMRRKSAGLSSISTGSLPLAFRKRFVIGFHLSRPTGKLGQLPSQAQLCLLSTGSPARTGFPHRTASHHFLVFLVNSRESESAGTPVPSKKTPLDEMRAIVRSYDELADDPAAQAAYLGLMGGLDHGMVASYRDVLLGHTAPKHRRRPKRNPTGRQRVATVTITLHIVR